MENKELEVIKGEVSNAMRMVEETTITNEEELGSVAEKIKLVKQLGKLIREKMELYTKPAREIIANAQANYLPYEKNCKEAEAILKSKASVYMQEVEAERIRKEKIVEKGLETGRLKEGTAIKKLENIGEEKKTIKTDSGASLTRKMVKVAEIVDESLIPKEYWIVDEKKVKKVALAGVEIPGVVVKEIPQISSR